MVRIPVRNPGSPSREGRGVRGLRQAAQVREVNVGLTGGATPAVPDLGGGGTEEIGTALFEIGADIRAKDIRRKRLDEALFLEETGAEYKQRLAEGILEIQKTVPPSDSSYVDRVRGLTENLTIEFGQRRSPHGLDETKARLGSSLAVRGTEVITGSIQENASALEKKAVDAYQAVVNELADRARDASGSYGQLRAELEARLDPFRGQLNENLERDTFRDAELSLLKATIEGLNDREEFDKARALVKDKDLTEFLTGEQREAIENGINTTERQTERQKKIDAAEAKRVEAEALERNRMKQADDFLARMQPGAENPTTARQVIDSDLKEGTKRAYLSLLEQKAKPQPIKTDPEAFIGLYDRIHLPDGDPDKITDEDDLNQFVIGRVLSYEDLGKLRNEIQGKRTQAGDIESTLKKGLVSIAKSELTGTNQLMGLRDPRGDTQLQRFMSFFLTEYQAQRQGGKTPTQLLDPDSADYIGKALSRFKRTPVEFMRDLMEANPDIKNTSIEPPVR